jgi:hypothetical protein
MAIASHIVNNAYVRARFPNMSPRQALPRMRTAPIIWRKDSRSCKNIAENDNAERGSR